ncbi:hypothetical protein GOM49_06870 [Clostridium bovifaecis]|uniref:PTS EIIA type-1 domain-containing protein n=1 Tax=Clostridium bovifaecis TaxID=2184719 RepID=A0A6I6EVA8_9CLOT|nr:hypothetical protein GOM49_06870 [Clostridium bovifaecis]
MFRKLFGAFKKDENIKQNLVDDNTIVSPLDGTILDISSVPDAVFSQKMMGDGFAIEPDNGDVVSPVTGTISSIFPTKHAIGIIANNGLELLVHFGLDTVNLQGEGFEALVKDGDKIKAGQPLLRVNLEQVKGNVPSVITPIVFTNLSEGKKVLVNAGRKVKRGESGVVSIIK